MHISALCHLFAEEKKAVKRSYQKIQEDEEDDDDDYRNHTSPRNSDSSANQLVRTLASHSNGIR